MARSNLRLLDNCDLVFSRGVAVFREASSHAPRAPCFYSLTHRPLGQMGCALASAGEANIKLEKSSQISVRGGDGGIRTLDTALDRITV